MTEIEIDCECSRCGQPLRLADKIRGSDGPRPLSPGDTVVCGHCGAALVYDVVRRLRRLTWREFSALDLNARRAIHAARKAAKGESMKTTGDTFLIAACAVFCSLCEVLP